MRAVWRLTAVIGFALLLSACSGSSGGNPVPDTTACGVGGCGRDEAPAAPLACGGGAEVSCPNGYRCFNADNTCDPATGMGCDGTCMLGEEPLRCGGLTGTRCPAGYACVDDPTDACDGGPAVDCEGVCQPEPNGQCAADADCPQLEVACSICADGSVSCPLARCDNGQCTVDFKPCSEAQVCGGISRLSCAAGFHCVDDPTDGCAMGDPADCRGICVPDDMPPSCNGVAGVTCPPGFECVDDPGDMCDPNTGADCPGVCQRGGAGECSSDAECPPLRAPCSTCSDGNEACARSICENGHCTVVVPPCTPPMGCEGGCPPGEICVAEPNGSCDPATGVNCSGKCVPSTDPRSCNGMAGDTCPEGYECVDQRGDDCDPDSGGADCPGVCEPKMPPQCHADDECAQVLAPCSLCADGSYACPRAECRNGVCSVVFDACPGPGFCGGIAGFPCAPGFTCIDDPRDDCDPKQGGADCAGVCIREEEQPSCGGITGAQCVAGYECVDDPRDDCDPDANGADCPGVCRPAPNPPCMSDAECPALGAPCRLCPDGTAACPQSLCDMGKCRVDFSTCPDEPMR